MTSSLIRWTPAVLLVLGALVTEGVDTQRRLPLREPLAATVPTRIAGYVGRDDTISEAEIKVVGVSNYLFRIFSPPPEATTSDDGDPAAAAAGSSSPDAAPAPAASGTLTAAAAAPFSLYVGFYEQQARGRTIHSPKNCLPGAGWEALTSTTRTLAVGDRTVTVNQYLIQRDEQQALVLYWYQGRGRVEANEYKVKFDLLRDSALKGRSDEALVRLVVPVTTTQENALDIATGAAAEVIPRLDAALPA